MMDLKKLNFNKAGIEKVQRLIPVLKFLNNSKNNGLFALKGGTAINLFLLSFKRLSVDIDLDYMVNDLKDNVYKFRKKFNLELDNFMQNMGYTLSPKSFHTYALSSFVYKYKNMSGNIDNLKIEINYGNRAHILMPEQFTIDKLWTNNPFKIQVTNSLELCASKFSALIMRSSPRDLYDSYRIIQEDKIWDLNIFKKCLLFYTILSDENYINNEQY